MEIINQNIQRGVIRCALFDFDGTISLIRADWRNVMQSLMLQSLLNTPQHEGEEKLRYLVTHIIEESTGKPTIYQMEKLCEEISKRGGQPFSPAIYKKMFYDLLYKKAERTLTDLREGRISPKKVMVPGVLDFLRALQEYGVTCYLASGGDKEGIIEEANLLGISTYFVNVWAPSDDDISDIKKIAVEQIINDRCPHGSELAVFGDGVAEVEAAKAVGATAVGVASNDDGRPGINMRKRRSLVSHGADVIIPNFGQYKRLLKFLFG